MKTKNIDIEAINSPVSTNRKIKNTLSTASFANESTLKSPTSVKSTGKG